MTDRHDTPVVGIQRVTQALGFYEVLALTAAIWFIGKFLRYAFPPLFDTFQAAYGVSSTEVGLAFSAFMICYAALQFPSGVLADRFGSTRIITAGAVVAGFGALWVFADPPFVLLVVAMAVIGAGTGVHKTVAIRLLARTYETHTGRTFGIFDTIGAFGGVIAPVAVAGILGLTLVAWPVLFGVTGAVVLGVAMFFFWRQRAADGIASSSQRSDRLFPWRSYLHTFRRPRLLAFVGVTVFVAFTYNGIIAFLPLYLTVEAGISPAVASLLYSGLFLASVTQLVTGEAADRFGPLRVLIACIVGLLVGLLGVLSVNSLAGGGASHFGMLVAVVALVGVGAHGYRPARDVYLVYVFPDSITGGGLGVVRTLLMGSGAIAPAVVGIVADHTSFSLAFFGLAAVATVGLGLAIVVAVLERQHRIV